MKRRYGRAHALVRKKYVPIVARGEAVCARCGKPILPGTAWDLDHDDSDPLQRRYLGPSHRSCNRASTTHLRQALAEARGEQAAANGVGREAAVKKARPPRFDGLPDPTPENSVDRWSRHWSGGFNPRCRDCRELGSACAAAEPE